MKCTGIVFDGMPVIVCGSARRLTNVCEYEGCGKPAVSLCDWRGPARGPSCDMKLCASHAFQPQPRKDLCPTHRIAYERWKAQRHAPVPETYHDEA